MSDKVKRTKAAVIGISESKLDSTVLDSEICIENYEIIHGEVLLLPLAVTLAINEIEIVLSIF